MIGFPPINAEFGIYDNTKPTNKGGIPMHQQLIMNIIDLFTPQSKADFYRIIFDTIDLSSFPDEINPNNSGPSGFSRFNSS
jgi:hypothetical protein